MKPSGPQFLKISEQHIQSPSTPTTSVVYAQWNTHGPDPKELPIPTTLLTKRVNKK